MKQAFSALLALLVFWTQGLGADLASASLWSERRRAAQIAPVAPLPALKTIEPGRKIKALSAAGPLAAPLIALPELESKFGAIQAVIPPNASPRGIIVHIQDIHQNPEAQSNIAALVKAMAEAENVGVIGLEAEFEPIPIGALKSFPYPKSLAKAARYLLKENRISGPIEALFTTPTTNVRLAGIDDRAAYKGNVEAYRSATRGKAAAKKIVDRQKERLASDIEKTMSAPLKRALEETARYHDGRLPLERYARIVATERLNDFPELSLFIKASELERSLDFAAVERERSKMLAQIVSGIGDAGQRSLMARSAAYRSGALSHAEFYEYLKKIALDAGADWQAYPWMDRYVRYVLTVDGINGDKLLAELESAESRFLDSLARNDADRALLTGSKRAELVQKLLRFELTPREWAAYRELCGDQEREELKPFEDFYRYAQIRDQKMAANMASAMGQNAASIGALVTGGFHSTGIESILRERGYAIVRWSPKLTKIEELQGPASLSVFTQEKTPLEKLFKGDKLFLGQPAIPRESRLSAITGAVADAVQIAPSDQSKIALQAADTLARFGVPIEGSPAVTPAADGKVVTTKPLRVGPNATVRDHVTFDEDLEIKNISSSVSTHIRWTLPLFENILLFALMKLFALTGVDAWILAATLSAISSLVHSLIYRNASPLAIAQWFLGTAALSALMSVSPAAAGFITAWLLHSAWNNYVLSARANGWAGASWMLPLSLMLPPSPPSETENRMKELLKNKRSLVFSGNADAIEDAILKVKSPTQNFLRVTLSDQFDLDRLKYALSVVNGEPVVGEGALPKLVRENTILLLDYNGSDSNLVEGLSELFDGEGKYDGRAVSPSLKIVGVLSSAQFGRYPVSVYSRYQEITHINAEFNDPVDELSAPPADLRTYPVELFESPMTFEKLVEDYALDENGDVRIMPGALAEAEKTGRPLLIRGGDWTDSRLRNTVRDALRRGVAIYRKDGGYGQSITGKEFVLPNQGDVKLPAWVINSETVDILFARISVRLKNGVLAQTPGLLNDKAVRLRITSDLPDWVWNMVMHAKANINIELAPGIAVPKQYRSLAMKTQETAPPEVEKTWGSEKTKKAFLVESGDHAYLEALAHDEYGKDNVRVFHVSPQTGIDDITASLEKTGPRTYAPKKQEWLEALEKGDTVIIEGLHGNPGLLAGLETALSDSPYLLVNGERIFLKDLKGRLILSKRAGSKKTGELELAPTDEEYERILKKEYPARYRVGDLAKIKKIFELLPRNGRITLARLRMLYLFDNRLEAFDATVFDELREQPETRAYLRVTTRLLFNQEENGRANNSVHGKRLARIQRALVPSVDGKDYFWRLADTLSLDLLNARKQLFDTRFDNTQAPPLKKLIGTALLKKYKDNPDRAAFYRYKYALTAVNANSPEIDDNTTAGEDTWESRRDRVVFLIKNGVPVFLIGSPGTGKSFIADQVAGALNKSTTRINTGSDIKEWDVHREQTFVDGKTKVVPKQIALWAKDASQLLAVDEANLAPPTFWNFLRNYKKPFLFTGNQRSLAGRNDLEIVDEDMATIYFPEFDGDFLVDYAKSPTTGLAARTDREKLAQTLVDLHLLFAKAGNFDGFSLRDLQELIDRINEFAPAGSGMRNVIGVAWGLYRGHFNPDTRAALRYFILRKFGVDIEETQKKERDAISDETRAAFKRAGLTLVPALEDLVAEIQQSLAMRIKRIASQQKGRGKRGMILEAASGRGKDATLATELEQSGFLRSDKAPAGADPTKIYYHLNASLNYDKMIDTIELARKQGSAVIISEMNLLPSALLEGKLNDILTGENSHPGFFFFATINPERFNSREKLSTALQNRVIYNRLRDYTRGEFLDIAAEANESGRFTAADLQLIANTHTWVRSRINNPNYHPTTREIKNLVALGKQGMSVDEAIERVYKPFFLDVVLGGLPLPAPADRAIVEAPFVDRDRMLKIMAALLNPPGAKDFTLFTIPDSATNPGFFSHRDYGAAIREKELRENNWEKTFWHELAGHGIWTREMPFLQPSGDAPLDPLYQDMLDLKNIAAIHYFFPYAGMGTSPADELEFAAGGAIHREFSDRKKFQYALVAYARGTLARATIERWASRGGKTGYPFKKVLPHLDKAKAIIGSFLKDPYDEEIKQFQEFRLAVMVNQMEGDYVSLGNEADGETPSEPGEEPVPASETRQDARASIDIAPVKYEAGPIESQQPIDLAQPESPSDVEIPESSDNPGVGVSLRENLLDDLRALARQLVIWRSPSQKTLDETQKRLTDPDTAASLVARIALAGTDETVNRLVETIRWRLEYHRSGSAARLQSRARWITFSIAVLLLIFAGYQLSSDPAPAPPIAPPASQAPAPNIPVENQPIGAETGGWSIPWPQTIALSLAALSFFFIIYRFRILLKIRVPADVFKYLPSAIHGVTVILIAYLIYEFSRHSSFISIGLTIATVMAIGWLTSNLVRAYSKKNEESGEGAAGHDDKNNLDEIEKKPIFQETEDFPILNVFPPVRPRTYKDLSDFVMSKLEKKSRLFTQSRSQADKSLGPPQGRPYVKNIAIGKLNAGFIRAGSRPLNVKKKVVINWDRPARVYTHLNIEILSFLKDQGFEVLVPEKPLSAADQEKIKARPEYELINAENLQAEFESIYLYGALRLVNSNKSLEEKIATARKFAESLKTMKTLNDFFYKYSISTQATLALGKISVELTEAHLEIDAPWEQLADVEIDDVAFADGLKNPNWGPLWAMKRLKTITAEKGVNPVHVQLAVLGHPNEYIIFKNIHLPLTTEKKDSSLFRMPNRKKWLETTLEKLEKAGATPVIAPLTPDSFDLSIHGLRPDHAPLLEELAMLRIESLSLSGTWPDLSFLKNIFSLRSLQLQPSQPLNPASIKHLKNLRNLERLTIGKHRDIEQYLLENIDQWPRLERIVFSANAPSESAVLNLVEKSPRQDFLIVTYKRTFSKGALKPNTTLLPKMEVIRRIHGFLQKNNLPLTKTIDDVGNTLLDVSSAKQGILSHWELLEGVQIEKLLFDAAYGGARDLIQRLPKVRRVKILNAGHGLDILAPLKEDLIFLEIHDRNRLVNLAPLASFKKLETLEFHVHFYQGLSTLLELPALSILGGIDNIRAPDIRALVHEHPNPKIRVIGRDLANKQNLIEKITGSSLDTLFDKEIQTAAELAPKQNSPQWVEESQYIPSWWGLNTPVVFDAQNKTFGLSLMPGDGDNPPSRPSPTDSFLFLDTLAIHSKKIDLIPMLSSAFRLRRLSVRYVPINVADLFELVNLEELYIRDRPMSNHLKIGLRVSINRMKKLTTLNLTGTGFTRADAFEILASHPNKENLVISTDDGVFSANDLLKQQGPAELHLLILKDLIDWKSALSEAKKMFREEGDLKSFEESMDGVLLPDGTINVSELDENVEDVIDEDLSPSPERRAISRMPVNLLDLPLIAAVGLWTAVVSVWAWALKSLKRAAARTPARTVVDFNLRQLGKDGVGLAPVDGLVANRDMVLPLGALSEKNRKRAAHFINALSGGRSMVIGVNNEAERREWLTWMGGLNLKAEKLDRIEIAAADSRDGRALIKDFAIDVDALRNLIERRARLTPENWVILKPEEFGFLNQPNVAAALRALGLPWINFNDDFLGIEVESRNVSTLLDRALPALLAA